MLQPLEVLELNVSEAGGEILGAVKIESKFVGVYWIPDKDIDYAADQLEHEYSKEIAKNIKGWKT